MSNKEPSTRNLFSLTQSMVSYSHPSAMMDASGLTSYLPRFQCSGVGALDDILTLSNRFYQDLSVLSLDGCTITELLALAELLPCPLFHPPCSGALPLGVGSNCGISVRTH
jgi:hypothetical protein